MPLNRDQIQACVKIWNENNVETIHAGHRLSQQSVNTCKKQAYRAHMCIEMNTHTPFVGPVCQIVAGTTLHYSTSWPASSSRGQMLRRRVIWCFFIFYFLSVCLCVCLCSCIRPGGIMLRSMLSHPFRRSETAGLAETGWASLAQGHCYTHTSASLLAISSCCSTVASLQ